MLPSLPLTSTRLNPLFRSCVRALSRIRFSGRERVVPGICSTKISLAVPLVDAVVSPSEGAVIVRAKTALSSAPPPHPKAMSTDTVSAVDSAKTVLHVFFIRYPFGRSALLLSRRGARHRSICLTPPHRDAGEATNRNTFLPIDEKFDGEIGRKIRRETSA
jgi:hypothetical protein